LFVVGALLAASRATLPLQSPRKNRRSLRLKGFDYSLPVAYFVTICTHERIRILGEVVDHAMRLSPAGEIVQTNWLDLPRRYPTVILHQFTVMPNHLHAIMSFAHTLKNEHNVSNTGTSMEKPSARDHLGKILRAFKSISAIEINRLLGRKNQPVWQRNYYEHIIRSPREFEKTRKYIYENPILWDNDPENV
jgi:REP element-mobilizing transposase RayT